MRKTLRDLLQDRFGPLPEEWQARIEAVSDADRLQEVIRQGWRVTRLEDLSL
jgi:hypothetical protein